MKGIRIAKIPLFVALFSCLLLAGCKTSDFFSARYGGYPDDATSLTPAEVDNYKPRNSTSTSGGYTPEFPL